MRPLGKAGLRRLRKELRRDRSAPVELVFLLQSVDDPVNVGGVFRVADACGAREVVLTGETPAPPHGVVSMTARGLERSVPWRYVRRVEDAIGELKGTGHHVVALEITEDAVAFADFAYPSKVCLVLGSEGRGVWPKTLRLCDAAVFVPMYGKGPSLNVHVAAAVVAYRVVMGPAATNQPLARHGA